MSETTDSDTTDEASTGKYPDGTGVRLAAESESERYYFRSPVGGITSMPAMNVEQARKLVADGVYGFGPSDFEQVDGFNAEPWEYPDPVDSGREVNAHDLMMLRYAARKGSRVGLTSQRPRKNPTEYTIQALLDEWDDASDVPIYDRDALQQADGIGPDRAGQVVGAAVANRLIERPVRGESDE